MIDKQTKSKWRRIFRRRKRQVAEIGSSSEQGFEKHVVRRLVRIPNVSRFLIGWVGLIIILGIGLVLQTRALSPKYQEVQPKPGGTFTEGIIGSFTNANPLYASSTVDSSVSRLVFSGLLKNDSENKLAGDLAESWTYDATETIYTVKLKPNLKWHDGQPLTAQDVVFTYQLIQNPETKSSLYSSWQNIKVEAKDDQTVVFTLPSSLSPFPYSMVNGIVPKHVLEHVNPAQLRLNSFNNETPVGSGPFIFSRVQVEGSSAENRQESVALKAFDQYNGGRPKLDAFIIRTFPNEQALTDAYGKNQVNAIVGLSSTPDQFKDDNSTVEYGIPLAGEVLVFFRTGQDVLKDPAVRKALVLAADKKEIFEKLPYPLASVDEPLLKTHTGYDNNYKQVTGNADEAKKQLDAAGWLPDPETGIRSKSGVKLEFKLNSRTTSEFSSVAGSLQKQWKELGADLKVELQSDEELQSTLSLHSYDALLYSISIGADPDVYAYWHSTQADPRSRTRLNFSEYKSTVADQALEGGRTRSDPQLRQVKYKPFLEAWRNDAPALALYQPRFLYLAHQPFHGYDSTTASTPADRFADVEHWMAREGFQNRD